MQESGFTEIIPWICTSAIWGRCPVVFESWASLGLTVGSGGSLMVAKCQVFFAFLWTLRTHGSHWRAVIMGDCDILVSFFFCSEFCHTLKWKGLGFTCLPHPLVSWYGKKYSISQIQQFFIFSFWSVCYVQDTLLGFGEPSVNKPEISPHGA